MITVQGAIVANKIHAYRKLPKRIWDNYEVVGEIQKSDRIKFVMAAAVRDGVRYVNIREFYCKVSTGEWKPGRDGITIPLMLPIEKGTKRIQPLDAFEILLTSTGNIAQFMDIYNDANAIYRKDDTDEN